MSTRSTRFTCSPRAARSRARQVLSLFACATLAVMGAVAAGPAGATGPVDFAGSAAVVATETADWDDWGGDDILFEQPSLDAYAPAVSGLAVPPLPTPATGDFTRYFDIAVLTPDGTFNVTDEEIRIYLEATENFWSAQTGYDFNFIVNDIRRGTSKAYGAHNHSVLHPEARALYGITDQNYYFNTPQATLWIFAPKDQFPVTPPWAAASAIIGSGVNSGGEVVTAQTATAIKTLAANPTASDAVLTIGTPAHEMGHVMGLDHASHLTCPDQPEGPVWDEADLGTCTLPVTADQYNDGWSVMGSGFQIGPASRYLLGLLDPSEYTTITAPVTNQTVVVHPQGGTSGVLTLVVGDPASGIDYLVEYRTRFYTGWVGGSWTGNGIRILRLYPDRETMFHTPGPKGTASYSQYLRAGETFISADDRVSITLQSVTTTAATLSVTVAQPEPVSLSQPVVSGEAVVGGTLSVSAVVSPVGAGVLSY
ncbi:MAG: hypothetical protein LBR19_07515, partial [Bifidobacteriaceae bacterium]|nr:hypothetical protein [Bifidobacteriaceae bacterium]